MSIIGRLHAARYLLEDGFGSLASRAGGLVKALSPQIMSSINIQRMNEPPRRGVSQALTAYSQSPWLQASTKKIAERFAAVEWQLFAQVGAGGEAMRLSDPRCVTPTVQRAYSNERQRWLTELKQLGEIKQIHRHPLLDLLANANPAMTGHAARLLTQVHRDIAGEAFWVLARNVAGKPDQFWPTAPTWVTGLPTGAKPEYTITIEGQAFKVQEEDVIWFREPDPAKPYGRGTGQAMSLSDELETDEYAARFIKTFFLNRAKPELLVSVEGFSGDELKASKQAFERQHQGFNRAHRSWWYNRPIKVKELTQKFTDMELSALRTWERDIVLQTFGIPPEQMGIVANSNRATAHESEKIMAVSVLMPRLESMREQLQDELVPWYDPRLILGFVSPVPDDRDFQLDAITAAPWAATRGEIRKMQGLQDRGSGDDVQMQPLNLIEVPAPKPDTVGSRSAGSLLRAASAAVVPKALDGAGITVILDALRPERIKEEIEPVWSEELQAWGDAALRDLGVDISFNLLNPLVVDHLREVVGERIDWIDNTTRQQLQTGLVEGVQAGEGYEDLSKRVQGVFGELETWRADRIARTETVNSASFASEEAWSQSMIVWGKEWLVTPGSERHGAAGYGGTTAQLGEDFHFGDGAQAARPGAFGEASQDINCMCAIMPVLDDPDKSTEEQQARWREINARRMVWERIALAAYRRGFKAQEKDVIEALAKATL